MTATALPLITDYRPERVFAWRDGQPVTAGCALGQIETLAARLDTAGTYVNLCENRYLFTLLLAAGSLARGVGLLPQSRAEGALAAIRATYPDARMLDDSHVAQWLAGDAGPTVPQASPTVEAAQRVAIVFTSGSTGQPGAHDKHWGDLVCGTGSFRRRFFGRAGPVNIVATVPPQHMYGLETSVLPALHAGFAADAGRPFMPWQVADALARVSAPRVLVTTPVHLRACLDAGSRMPALAGVISATAPLTGELAHAVEVAWHTRLYEIYGSTETGSVASRRPAETQVWTLYDGLELAERDGFWVSGGHLPAPLRLGDALSILDSRRFRLLGRAADMLKVAGKRMSVNDLTQRLLAIAGLEDAAVFVPPDAGERQRPAALVVAPGLDERAIATRLAEAVDPVFVPRPLWRVPTLPRNTLGKLPQRDLLELWRHVRAQRRRSPS